MLVWPRHKGGRVVHVQQHERKRRMAVTNGIVKVIAHQPAKQGIFPTGIAQFNQGGVAHRAILAARRHAHIAGQLQAGQPGAHFFKQGFQVFKQLRIKGCGLWARCCCTQTVRCSTAVYT